MAGCCCVAENAQRPDGRNATAGRLSPTRRLVHQEQRRCVGFRECDRRDFARVQIRHSSGSSRCHIEADCNDFEPRRRIHRELRHEWRGVRMPEFGKDRIRSRNPLVERWKKVDLTDQDQVVNRRRVGYNDYCRRKRRLVSASRSTSASVTGR